MKLIQSILMLIALTISTSLSSQAPPSSYDKMHPIFADDNRIQLLQEQMPWCEIKSKGFW